MQENNFNFLSQKGAKSDFPSDGIYKIRNKSFDHIVNFTLGLDGYSTEICVPKIRRYTAAYESCAHIG